MLQILKIAVRRVLRRPFVPVVTAALLGTGIGVGGGLLAVSATILQSPLPFPDSERLMQVGAVRLDQGAQHTFDYFSHSQFLDLADRSQSFASLGAIKEAGRGNVVHLTGVEEPLRLRAGLASRGFFACLATPPSVGRLFGDPAGEGAREILLSHALWTNHFGADPEVAGGKVLVDGQPHVIVGVMPPFLDENGSQTIHGGRIDLWLPLTPGAVTPGEIAYRILARLKTDVGPQAANQELAALAASEPGESLWRGAVPRVVPLREEVVAAARRHLHVLSFAGLILLGLTCLNAAGLLLARVERRRRDTAVQSALGASRMRLAGEAAGEALLIWSAATALALWMSFGAFQAFKTLAPGDLPRLGHLHWSPAGPVLVIGLALVCGALLVLVHLRQSAPRLTGLVSDADGPGLAPGNGRLRRWAVILETAGSVALLFSAGLLLQSFHRLSAADPGFDASDVLAYDIFLPESKYRGDDLKKAPRFYDALGEAVAGLPGVRGVAFTSSPPLAERDYFSSSGWRVRRVDDAYFDVIGAALLEGRGLSRDFSGRREAVVSRSLARRLFPQAGAVGGLVEGHEIVGVVADVRHESLDSLPQPAVYLSHRAEPDARMSMLVKTDGTRKALAALVKSRVRQIDPDQPVSQGVELTQLAGQSPAIVYRRLFLALLAAFSLAALALAATGFYALIAQFVERQATRLAIRMALGANPRDILLLVMSQTWRLVWIGAAAGLLATFWLSELQRSLLYETSPYDLATLLAVVALVLAVASLGSSIPAARAARLQPAQILRGG